MKLKQSFYIYLIPALIGILMLLLGSSFDLEISKSFWDPNKDNWFAVSFSIIAEMPTYLLSAFFGICLIEWSKKFKPFPIIFFHIIGTIGIVISPILIMRNTFDFDSFNTLSGTTIETVAKIITAIVTAAIMIAMYFIITKKLFKIFNPDKLMYLALFVAILFYISILIGVAAKYIAPRPRPRFVLSQLVPINEFKEWFDFKWFAGTTDHDFQSLPSLHSLMATTGVFATMFLLEITKFNKSNKKWIIYAVAVFYACICAFSRVVACAHFLSDSGIAIIIASIVAFLWDFIISRHEEKLTGIITKISQTSTKE